MASWLSTKDSASSITKHSPGHLFYILWSQVQNFSNYAADALKFTLMLDISNFIIWIYCLFLQIFCAVYSWLFNENDKSCIDSRQQECPSLVLRSHFIFLCGISCSFHCCLSFGMQLSWGREVCKKLAWTLLEKYPFGWNRGGDWRLTLMRVSNSEMCCEDWRWLRTVFDGRLWI